MNAYIRRFAAPLMASTLVAGWSTASYAQSQNLPPNLSGAEAATITGAFGIFFGQDIRPYLEGHYTNLVKDVKGPITFPSQKITYLLLKSPIDMSASFPPDSS